MLVCSPRKTGHFDTSPARELPPPQLWGQTWDGFSCEQDPKTPAPNIASLLNAPCRGCRAALEGVRLLQEGSPILRDAGSAKGPARRAFGAPSPRTGSVRAGTRGPWRHGSAASPNRLHLRSPALDGREAMGSMLISPYFPSQSQR